VVALRRPQTGQERWSIVSRHDYKRLFPSLVASSPANPIFANLVLAQRVGQPPSTVAKRLPPMATEGVP
jgi:hypothetical protein